MPRYAPITLPSSQIFREEFAEARKTKALEASRREDEAIVRILSEMDSPDQFTEKVFKRIHRINPIKAMELLKDYKPYQAEKAKRGSYEEYLGLPEADRPSALAQRQEWEAAGRAPEQPKTRTMRVPQRGAGPGGQDIVVEEIVPDKPGVMREMLPESDRAPSSDFSRAIARREQELKRPITSAEEVAMFRQRQEAMWRPREEPLERTTLTRRERLEVEQWRQRAYADLQQRIQAAAASGFPLSEAATERYQRDIEDAYFRMLSPSTGLGGFSATGREPQPPPEAPVTQEGPTGLPQPPVAPAPPMQMAPMRPVHSSEMRSPQPPRPPQPPPVRPMSSREGTLSPEVLARVRDALYVQGYEATEENVLVFLSKPENRRAFGLP